MTTRVEEDVDILLSGFDRELTFQKLEDSCILLNRGVTWLATNPDWVCPTWYGAGAGLRQRVPDADQRHRREPIFIGKPQPAMAELAMRRTGFGREETVLIGDRVYTDIACAVNAGIDSILVLSGEGTREDTEKFGVRPTWIYDDIAAVYREMEETP